MSNETFSLVMGLAVGVLTYCIVNIAIMVYVAT